MLAESKVQVTSGLLKSLHAFLECFASMSFRFMLYSLLKTLPGSSVNCESFNLLFLLSKDLKDPLPICAFSSGSSSRGFTSFSKIYSAFLNQTQCCLRKQKFLHPAAHEPSDARSCGTECSDSHASCCVRAARY